MIVSGLGVHMELRPWFEIKYSHRGNLRGDNGFGKFSAKSACLGICN